MFLEYPRHATLRSHGSTADVFEDRQTGRHAGELASRYAHWLRENLCGRTIVVRFTVSVSVSVSVAVAVAVAVVVGTAHGVLGPNTRPLPLSH